MKKPQETTIDEWKEITHVPEVRESRGLENETPEVFADMVSICDAGAAEYCIYQVLCRTMKP